MAHTILYLGPLDLNFRNLRGDTDRYVNADDKTMPADEPSKNARGIRFGYMQRGNEFFAVRVDKLVLRAPVLLVCERHTDGKGFGPNASLLKDVAAMRILVDAIIANPEYRDVFSALIRENLHEDKAE